VARHVDGVVDAAEEPHIPVLIEAGASEVLGDIFGEAGRHARSAVGVPVLPLDSPVEVEVVFRWE